MSRSPLLMAVALFAAFAAPAHAGSNLAMANIVDGAPLDKPVTTLRDLRYRDMVRQQYDFSCGSAALASVLRYGYGMEVDEPHMIRSMLVGNDPKEVVRNGFSMLDMKHYVEGIDGFRAHGFRIDAAALYRLQMPVIALLDLHGYKHFVVVKGAQAGRVFVADPALGHRVMNEQDFVKGWNGIVLAVVGNKPLENSYLVNGRQSVALARRGDAVVEASMPVPVVELGLVRADLF